MSKYTEAVPGMLLDLGRSIGQSMGYELVVELSDHGIQISMEKPDEERRAWDPSLYSSGNVYVKGYSNPIKPRVQQHTELADPDTVDVVEGDVADSGEPEDGEETDGGPHVQLISSGRYRDYMRQDLISQLLTPESRWTLMVYALIAIGALQFISMIVTLYGTGAF